MSSVRHSYVFVCHPYVTCIYSYVIRMSLVSTRMSSVCHSYTRMSSMCHSYVLVCHPYVTRILVCHPHVTRMHSYFICMSLVYSFVIRMSLVCGFSMNPLLPQCVDEFLYLFITHSSSCFFLSIKLTFLMSSEIYNECREY